MCDVCEGVCVCVCNVHSLVLLAIQVVLVVRVVQVYPKNE